MGGLGGLGHVAHVWGDVEVSASVWLGLSGMVGEVGGAEVGGHVGWGRGALLDGARAADGQGRGRRGGGRGRGV
jgi:hypothetical protein